MAQCHRILFPQVLGLILKEEPALLTLNGIQQLFSPLRRQR